MFRILTETIRLFFANRPSRLLIVLQNNHELRGGGGFITQLIDVELGRMRCKLHFRNEYRELRSQDSLSPPAPIRRYLHLSRWHLRDANYEADFEKSAEQIRTMYGQLFPQNHIAAVFAVNFSFLEDLLRVIGEIGTRTHTFKADSVFYHLTNASSDVDLHDMKELSARKEILRDLFFALIKAMILRPWKWPAVYSLVRKSIGMKDIQLFFFDKKTQQILIGKKLFHPFRSAGAKDFLSVVENNYLGLKSNRYIRRMVFHDVRFGYDRDKRRLGEASVDVRIRTEHFGTYDYPLSGTYQSYTWVYVPAAAKDIRVTPHGIEVETEEDGDFRKIGFHRILGVGSSMEVGISYTLPSAIFKDNDYSFRYIKQSGVKNEYLFNSVTFPDQYEVEAKGAGVTVKESKLFSSVNDLAGDSVLEVKASLHKRPPRIFYHEIVGPKSILVRFNEPVSLGSDKPNQITVSDKASGRKYPVSKTEFANDNRHLYIHLADLPAEEEKFYTVTLGDIFNMAGVPLTPAPRKITVVYRPSNFPKG